MTERKQVQPKDLIANGLWNPFSGRKKYLIVCGNCEHSYSDKVPVIEGVHASSLCPSCGAQNMWDHLVFAEAYERNLRRAS